MQVICFCYFKIFELRLMREINSIYFIKTVEGNKLREGERLGEFADNK